MNKQQEAKDMIHRVSYGIFPTKINSSNAFTQYPSYTLTQYLEYQEYFLLEKDARKFFAKCVQERRYDYVYLFSESNDNKYIDINEIWTKELPGTSDESTIFSWLDDSCSEYPHSSKDNPLINCKKNPWEELVEQG